jgi:hypothetical protein
VFDLSALAKHYETLTDAELLRLRSEGGLTDEAKPVLANAAHFLVFLSPGSSRPTIG